VNALPESAKIGCAAMISPDPLSVGARLARLHFPGIDDAISRLLRRDGNFRDMCVELAELEAAIVNASAAGEAQPDIVADWIAVRHRLIAEMAEALSLANVVPIKAMGRQWK
jgi:hypothetical protein